MDSLDVARMRMPCVGKSRSARHWLDLPRDVPHGKHASVRDSPAAFDAVMFHASSQQQIAGRSTTAYVVCVSRKQPPWKSSMRSRQTCETQDTCN